jgi:hypothetical protein
MMFSVRLAAAVLIVGCGRVGFDATTASTDATKADAMTTDGALQSFCAQHVTADLCTDFDDNMATDWIEGGITNGSYTVANGVLMSTINDLASATDVGEGYLNHSFAVVGSRIVLSVDVRIDQIGQGDAVLAQVLFSGAQRHGLEYVYREDGSYVEEFRDETFDPYSIPGSSFSLDAWHRIEMDMDLRATPHMIVRQDGGVVIDTDLVGTATGTMRASIGLIFLRGPSTSWIVRTDNVLVDIE